MNEDETILEYLKHLPERLREAREAREAERQRHFVVAVPEQKTVPGPEESNESEADQQAEKAWYQRISGATWLFICGIAFYLFTRLSPIEKSRSNFFSDEAIQTLAMKRPDRQWFSHPDGSVPAPLFQQRRAV